MTTYPLKKLVRMWARGELTVAQAIGHIIQHLIRLEKRLDQMGQTPQSD